MSQHADALIEHLTSKPDVMRAVDDLAGRYGQGLELTLIDFDVPDYLPAGTVIVRYRVSHEILAIVFPDAETVMWEEVT